MHKLRKREDPRFLFIVTAFCVFLAGPLSSVFAAEPQLDEKSDKKKTVWTISGDDSKDEYQEDKKNSWEMLKNMNMWYDRQGVPAPKK